ncbi:DUF1178 family protein [Aerophototrophica crusticola]|uniref:DUF1178 family protein n=1 Tax=Aerophototrophica crusticola TaxID=1709002 RepID=A0A858R9R4_9PROT|nr:DUF1178 family protein [Rhodospirillaceae bacterium B3]
MILFELKCGKGHRFEGWFRNGAAYEAQAAAKAITCPVCNDTGIDKAPMAPRIAKGGRKEREEAPSQAPAEAAAPVPVDPVKQQQAEILRQLRDLRRQVEANADHVGERFAEEARKIHYGEAPSRAIYGDATEEQAESLREEGIEVARIPWVPTGN